MNFVFHRAGFRISASGGLRSTSFEDWPFGRKAKERGRGFIFPIKEQEAKDIRDNAEIIDRKMQRIDN